MDLSLSRRALLQAWGKLLMLVPALGVVGDAATGAPASPTGIPAAFAGLSYQPVPKNAYAGNPRRDVKGLYVTRFTASSSNAMRGIQDLVSQTSLNALVIDVKDDAGLTLHRSAAAEAHNPKATRDAPIRDLAAWVQRMRQRNLYLIARIVTFKDPVYAEAHPQRAIVHRRNGRLYRSRDGLAWGSPHDGAYRAYNLAVAAEAAAAGFNEVQFDYIRFPEISDETGIDYRNGSRQTKAEAVQSFLLEARRVLSPMRVYLSADVFGLVCTARDDMDIGQFWEAISNAVDYISPMTYPSHYASGSFGLAAPDLHPFEVQDRAMRDAQRRNANTPTPALIRPWLQGFTASWLAKHKTYGVAEMRAQIRALEENGIHSYLIWNPRNRYREFQEALR